LFLSKEIGVVNYYLVWRCRWSWRWRWRWRA